MRVAFFGGSFDPPHRGHLAIARAAADQFHLDQVLFAPAALQPLKGDVRYTPYSDRLAMVELVCQQDARFLASRLDAPRADGQPNYTVDTLTALRGSLAPEDQLFCLVGADSFHDLPRWRDPQRLLALCDWIVVSRPGYELPALSAELSQRVHLLDGVYEDVSATAIREAIKHGFVETHLLPAVADYIRQHHLYE
ncbi:MAG: nicotinate-nucleotide adenylyltransferase [Acidobacteriaceae bacterium]